MMLDVTEDVKAIMKAVRDINSNGKKLTLVQLAHIFKGSDLKKIRQLGLHTFIVYNNDNEKKNCIF
jgi:hypothetical protein